MAARLEQTTAALAGQQTYVIIARSAAFGCAPSVAPAAVVPSQSPAAGAAQQEVRLNGQNAGGEMAQPTGELTVWIDKRSFLPLRMEVRDAQGVVVDRSEVSRVDYDVPMP